VLFGTGLGLASIDALEHVVALETQFDFEFPDPRGNPSLTPRSVDAVVDELMRCGREAS